MSVCSDDLLLLAEMLVKTPEEVNSRACIGRSYYALYHQALIAADALGLPVDYSVKTAHEMLIRRFMSGTKGLASIGKTIRKQKQMRAMADYEVLADLNNSDARLHLAMSRRLVEDLRRITAADETQRKT